MHWKDTSPIYNTENNTLNKDTMSQMENVMNTQVNVVIFSKKQLHECFPVMFVWGQLYHYVCLQKSSCNALCTSVITLNNPQVINIDIRITPITS